MLITRKSSYSGIVRTLDLDVSQEQMDAWNTANPPHIEDYFSHLPASDRDFILTGITVEERDGMFPQEEEEDLDVLEDDIDRMFEEFKKKDDV